MTCRHCSGTGVVPCVIHNWEWPGSCDAPYECVFCGGSGFDDDLAVSAPVILFGEVEEPGSNIWEET